MKKTSDKDGSFSSSTSTNISNTNGSGSGGGGGGGWVDIKTLLITMLGLGVVFMMIEVAIRYNRPTCSLVQVENAMRSLSIEGSLLGGQSKIHEGAPNETTISKKEESFGRIDTNVIENANGGTKMSMEAVEDNEGLKMVKRGFTIHGSAASVFVEFGAYRLGDDTFGVVGLGSKPLHVYGHAGFECEWRPDKGGNVVKGRADKMLPDWGYGRVYTVVVVNCTFPKPITEPGKLALNATWQDGTDGAPTRGVSFVALEEADGEYAVTSARYKAAAPKYDFLYCGSSLYGDLNPRRVREWLAYHVRLMGPRSHFVFHDAGGLTAAVRRVLTPWQRLGYVSVHDIREQARFDGYYHNQFMVVNDCLLRTRHLANWTFFFDVDEYLYVAPPFTLTSLMRSFSGYTQITYEQSPMSPKLCARHPNTTDQWGFEKLIYRNVKRGLRWDRKYAIQSKNVFATGVHMSENMIGKTLHTNGPTLKYYHYHNTITTKDDQLCKDIVNKTSMKTIIYSNKDPFKVDFGLQYFAQQVKDFELQHIGPQH